ncbi:MULTISPECIES: hypothetical protein [unclassified Streptomyces]|uniref:hypothetical protein n=1 Tax=unclassified Streptomyces TaxID=2593676 RepID=UPI00225129C9|nr:MULTISPECIES: hypothetical protein [unclassified Streptomyces]MCX5053434.1 hypothetical protein [Streptomyces sp. NBC_00474]
MDGDLAGVDGLPAGADDGEGLVPEHVLHDLDAASLELPAQSEPTGPSSNVVISASSGPSPATTGDDPAPRTTWSAP